MPRLIARQIDSREYLHSTRKKEEILCSNEKSRKTGDSAAD